MVLSHEARAHWFGFHSGWKEWKPVKDCVGLTTSSSMSHTSVAYSTPSTPQFDVSVLEVESDENQTRPLSEVTLTDTKVKAIEDAKESNRRKFKRIDLKLHAEIICQDQTYETFTTDVSVGGIAVEGCLPDWIAGYCTVVLRTLDHSHSLEFMCSVVENQKGKNYRLELHPSIDTKELESWLLHGVPLDKAE